MYFIEALSFPVINEDKWLDFFYKSLTPYILTAINPLPNTPFCDCPKFKEAADEN